MNVQPQPGDAVVIFNQRTGEIERAVIDGARYPDGSLMAVINASAFREGSYISCSGGPCPAIEEHDLRAIGTADQRFWRWKDRPRAGGGEDYVLNVTLWAWVQR